MNQEQKNRFATVASKNGSGQLGISGILNQKNTYEVQRITVGSMYVSKAIGEKPLTDTNYFELVGDDGLIVKVPGKDGKVIEVAVRQLNGELVRISAVAGGTGKALTNQEFVDLKVGDTVSGYLYAREIEGAVDKNGNPVKVNELFKKER